MGAVTANLADDSAHSRVGDGDGDLHALLRGGQGPRGHGGAERAHAGRHVAAAHGRRVAVTHRKRRKPVNRFYWCSRLEMMGVDVFLNLLALPTRLASLFGGTAYFTESLVLIGLGIILEAPNGTHPC